MFRVLESQSPFQFFQWPLEFWTEFCFVEEKTRKICGKTCGQFRLEESVLTVASEFFFFPSPHCRFPACSSPLPPGRPGPGTGSLISIRGSEKNEHSCHMTCTLGFYFVLDSPWFSFLFFFSPLSFCGLVCCNPEALSSKPQRDSLSPEACLLNVEDFNACSEESDPAGL